MSFLLSKRKNIKAAIFIYWLVLFYTIAALVWWFISLQNQSKDSAKQEIQSLSLKISVNEHPLLYEEGHQLIQQKLQRKTTKHISEGLTFLLVILLGAVFVYRAVKKQFQLNKQQQNFIMAVTHELKTPIAISKLNIETLQKRKLEPAQQEKLLQNTLAEMHRLNDLATNILVVSQIESGDYKMHFENVDLTSLVQQLVRDLKKQYAPRNIEAAIAENVYQKGDALMLKLVFSNLIDNAIKYAPKEPPIEVLLTEKEFIVKDQGPGISASDKKNVFEKFYRVGNESTRKAKGTGLGLFLCKRILSDHNAAIKIEDNRPNGSIFTISF